jgi:glycosyltransferase involved in cell wall biosynthesis
MEGKLMSDQTAAVIIPTTGRATLRQAVESVLAQTHPHTVAIVVVDGPQYGPDVLNTLDGLLPDPRIQILPLPQNTGAGGFNGHRVYGSVPLLLNQDWIFYLDDDNWYEPDHVTECIEACVEHGLDWCATMRNIYDADGSFVCVDECESLAVVPTWFGPHHHVDTSCFCLSRQVAVQLGPMWHRPHNVENANDGPTPDTIVATALMGDAPKHALIAKPTVNYALGSRELTPKPEFFLTGNQRMRERLGGRLPWEPAKAWNPTIKAAGWASSVERWDQFLVSLESFQRHHESDIACYLFFLSDPARLAEVTIPVGLRILTWDDFDPKYRTKQFLKNGVMTGFNRCMLIQRMQEIGHEQILMFDADMEVFAPLDDLFDTLATHDAIVTPHRLTPTPRDGKWMAMENFALFGNYNAGFNGWSNRKAARNFVDWWLEISVDAPEQAPNEGRYAEQGWLRFVADFVDKVHICRDPGINAAWWRLDTPEQIEQVSGRWLIDGVPLRLFHYSQIDFDDIESVTKWQNRIRGTGNLLTLYAQYREKVKNSVRSIVQKEKQGA